MPTEYFPGLEAPRQATFEDLGTPLHDVTFVVVDLETTGGSPESCAITEIGAVKYRGGECLGEFQTLVNPGVPIPPTITFLTGITEAMVLPAPPVSEVLPQFLEFVGNAGSGTVIGGHNVRFDVAFLDAALTAHGYPRLAHRRVDTIALARRLVRDEVPNLRLATLARHFRTLSDPVHRALADARATLEVLHALLERAGTYGVLGLDDLLALPTMRAHPSSGKLALTARLPRKPGVYLFRDRSGRVIYVGKATNLRARVRSYFGSDDRRKVPQLLRETEAIDHLVCAHPLEAEVREIRLIQEHEPRFNRRSKAWRSYAYLKLTLSERFPRLAVVREQRADGSLYVGPLRSTGAAQLVKEAIETALPLRRCTRRIGRAAPCSGAACVPAQLRVAACPCSGETGPAEYTAIVDVARRGLCGEPELLLGPLERRMQSLAATERFEEAAATRDRLRLLVRTLTRERTVDTVRRAARILTDGPDGPMEIVAGHLVIADLPLPASAVSAPDRLAGLDAPGTAGVATSPTDPRPARDEIDELLVVARWLLSKRVASRLRVRDVAGTLASALPTVPDYEPPREAAWLSR
jgi:DNA polymerase-3 subunit epsilon